MPLRFRIVERSLWLHGLFIVLALLGHDLLMATHAPVVAMAPATGVLHQHSPAHAAADMTAELPNGQPESPHPSVCGIGGTALFQTVDQVGVPDLNAATIAPSHFLTSAHSRTLLWEEPRWPPGTHRALLQVYRI